MIKSSSSGDQLNHTGRIYLKKLKLNKLPMWNDQNRDCPISQHRTIRKLLPRSKGNSKQHIYSPYLEISGNFKQTNHLKHKNNQSEFHLKLRKHQSRQIDADGQSIRVDVCFKGRKYTVYVQSRNSKDFAHAVKKELLAIIEERCDNVSQRLQIVGFETTSNEKELDYILSLDGIELNRNSYMLKPVIYSKKGQNVSIGDFTMVKCLGSGGFSQVFLVKGKFNNKYYAMKLMNKKFIIENERESIVENERYIMQIAKHPFLVELFYAFQTENHFAFVLQYCAGGELFYRLKKIKRMSEEDAKFYFVEILLGIQYLHENKIIYRDIKPENLLIGPDGHTLIADFGLAKPNIDSKTVSYSFCGSPQYMAPEMLTRAGHSFAIDYYCIGALLYELVTGLPPFYSKNHEQIYNSILNEQLIFPNHVDLSSEIKSLLRGLLDKNPKLRLGSYKGVAEILIHPWIGRLDKADVLAKKLKPPYIPDPYSFNFDGNELQGEIRQVFKRVLQEQTKPQPFEPYFSKQFTYQTKKDIVEKDFHKEFAVSNERNKQERKSKSKRHLNTSKTKSVEGRGLHKTPLKLANQRTPQRRLNHIASHRQL